MKTATVHIEGLTRLQYGAYHGTPKLDKENSDDYEERTWRKKAHADAEGRLFLPPMALKNALSATAKFLAIPIPGKGKNLYTKHFLSGVICAEPAMIAKDGLPVTIDDCQKVSVFGNSQGKRGGDGPRVTKFFPTVEPIWETTLKYMVLDDTITKPLFERVIEEVGKINGFGVFRPQSGGFYGRFTIRKIQWED